MTHSLEDLAKRAAEATPLPCPFCGMAETQTVACDSWWMIYCLKCFSSTANCRHNTREEAVAAWNTRHFPAVSGEGQARLQAELAKLPPLNDAHYINIVVRRNGKDEVYEADWLKTFKE